jgi:hypothetical protein
MRVGSNTARLEAGATGSPPLGTQRLAKHSSPSPHALADTQGFGPV